VQLTIIGAGAIGGTIGAHLIRDGHDVLLCDADPAHVEAINERGLTICGPVENFTVRARAVLPGDLPASLPRAAVAVKSHHTAAAAELLRGRLDPDGYVVSIQNGLTTGTLAAVVGPGRVVVSFVNFGADWLEPGRIMQGNVGTFRIGEPGAASATGSGNWPTPCPMPRPPTTSWASSGARKRTAPCCTPGRYRTCRSPTPSRTPGGGR